MRSIILSISLSPSKVHYQLLTGLNRVLLERTTGWTGSRGGIIAALTLSPERPRCEVCQPGSHSVSIGRLSNVRIWKWSLTRMSFIWVIYSLKMFLKIHGNEAQFYLLFMMLNKTFFERLLSNSWTYPMDKPQCTFQLLIQKGWMNSVANEIRKNVYMSRHSLYTVYTLPYISKMNAFIYIKC